MYLLLKTIHISFAFLSITGFVLRGVWMMQDSELLKNKAVKILPHIVDTVFLISGVSLVFTIDLSLLGQSWLLSKIFLLFMYIFLGAIALRGSNKAVKVSAFLAAVMTFIYIVGIAITKNPAGWFS